MNMKNQNQENGKVIKKAKVGEELLLEALGGDQGALDEFKRFQSREVERKIRKEIELTARELLEGELSNENEEALEILNKVYRKAWSVACKNLNYSEEEFPSKY